MKGRSLPLNELLHFLHSLLILSLLLGQKYVFDVDGKVLAKFPNEHSKDCRIMLKYDKDACSEIY